MLADAIPAQRDRPQVPLPAEFRGRARQLIARIRAKDAEWAAALRAVYAPLKDQRAGHPPDDATLARVAVDFIRRLPREGQLSTQMQTQPKSLRLAEMRLIGCQFTK